MGLQEGHQTVLQMDPREDPMADHDQTAMLTYDELAEARSISKKAAQTLARRRRWTRRKGNDGRVRVEVPVEELKDYQTVHQADPQKVHQIGLQTDLQMVPHDPATEALRTELTEVRVALARAEASLEAERCRIGSLEIDRDRFADLAAQLTNTVQTMERARDRGMLARLFGRAA